MEFIDLKTQYRNCRDSIDSRIRAVLDHGQFIMGPEVVELEARLARFVGVKHCISVSNGTDALLIGLMAAGVGRDDEIITTPLSFVAAAEVIALLGARPVFVDVDAATCNINPGRIDVALSLIHI